MDSYGAIGSIDGIQGSITATVIREIPPMKASTHNIPLGRHFHCFLPTGTIYKNSLHPTHDGQSNCWSCPEPIETPMHTEACGKGYRHCNLRLMLATRHVRRPGKR